MNLICEVMFMWTSQMVKKNWNISREGITQISFDDKFQMYICLLINFKLYDNVYCLLIK